MSNLALNPAGEAIRAYGKGVALATLAAGNITGRITTDAGNFADTFINNGQWNSRGTSDFGGGANSITNNGTVRTAGLANMADATTFSATGGTLSFGNFGILSLSDETPGNGATFHDTLIINGDFAGGDGILQLDAFIAGAGTSADLLTITGAVTGHNYVNIINTNPAVPSTPPVNHVIVNYTGASSPDAFTLAGLYNFHIFHH